MASGLNLLPSALPKGFRSFCRSAEPWLPKTWRTRLYGTELVRIYIFGDAIHRVWGPDV